MKSIELDKIRRIVASLWIFAVLNYLYCDVLSLMDPEFVRQLVQGGPPGITLTQGFLLGAGILMEIPMAMVLVSLWAPGKFARCANRLAGMVMTAVQIGSFWMGPASTLHYRFFSAVEITTTLVVVWLAWRRWPQPETTGAISG